ncbi:UDP-2,3-diacylglucosamine pyrophosphatase [invertebrate metagenome]|uniref:UDP-2,3-diacylglucosamine pyrophosphatase n=1 Tax=invertebrate metagenome TaxID=1711999 RepID=A0A484H7H2_9ZZZZ
MLFVLALQGYADPALVRGVPHAWVRLGAVQHGLKLLRRAGVHEVVMTGAVRRPSLWELRPDRCTMAFLARIGLKTLGDDGVLKAVIQELEAEGFRIVGVEDVVEDLIAPVGLYGELTPDEQAWADIRRGVEIARTLGALDVGQGAVVQQGLVLAVEAAEGTDAMLARCRSLARQEPGGVLVKVCKPSQERRADLPTIGITTLDNVAAAGLRGIAIEAGGTLVVNRQAVIERANRLGVFVVGISASALPL